MLLLVLWALLQKQTGLDEYVSGCRVSSYFFIKFVQLFHQIRVLKSIRDGALFALLARHCKSRKFFWGQGGLASKLFGFKLDGWGFAACIGKLGVVHFFVFVSKVGN
jgi:hypothetical protein